MRGGHCRPDLRLLLRASTSLSPAASLRTECERWLRFSPAGLVTYGEALHGNILLGDGMFAPSVGFAEPLGRLRNRATHSARGNARLLTNCRGQVSIRRANGLPLARHWRHGKSGFLERRSGPMRLG